MQCSPAADRSQPHRPCDHRNSQPAPIMSAAELPAPASGLFVEVSFRRLLASCADIVAGTSVARADLVGNWQRSPVFHHYVETLQEQLADLEAAAGDRLPRQLLERYSEHVEALSSRLRKPDLPAYCALSQPPPPVAALQPPRPTQQQQQTGRPAPAAVPLLAALRPAGLVPPAPVVRAPQLPPPQQPLPAPLQADPQQEAQRGSQQARPAAAEAAEAVAAAGPAATAAPPPPAASPPPPASSTAGQSRLQTQQQLHEDLTEELAGLAARLKDNTLAMEGRLRERGQLLDTTETALDASVQRTKESKERATQIHKRGRANFCLTCLVMLVVGLTFAAMYVFIKMTRLAGYRAAVPVPVAAPVPPTLPPPPPSLVHPTYEEHYEL